MKKSVCPTAKTQTEETDTGSEPGGGVGGSCTNYLVQVAGYNFHVELSDKIKSR